MPPHLRLPAQASGRPGLAAAARIARACREAAAALAALPPGRGRCPGAGPALRCRLEPVAAGSALTGAAGALGVVSARDWGYCRCIPDCRLTACLGGTGEEGEGRGGCASL